MPRDYGQRVSPVGWRMRRMFEEQGFGAVIFLFGVLFVFVFLPVFLVDDLLYVNTVNPEVNKRRPAVARRDRSNLCGNQSIRLF